MRNSIISEIESKLNLEKWFQKGGPGSGHHGHKGRKGRRGGSAPSRAGGIAAHKLSAPVGHAGISDNTAVNDWMSESVGGLYDTWEEATEQERVNLKAQVARDLSAASGVTEQEAADFVRQWAHSSNDDDMRSLALQQDAAKEFGLKTSEFTQQKIAPLKEKAAQVELKHELETEYFKAKRAGAPESELAALESKLDAQWERAYPGVDMGFVPSGGLGMKSGGGAKLSPLMESDKQRALMRSMYNETQAELKARGITEVRLYRGAGFPTGQTEYWHSQRGKAVSVSTNSVESWSVSRLVAGMFAGSGAGGKSKGDVGVVFEAVIPAKRILSTPATGFGCLTEGEVVILGGIGGDVVRVSEYY